MTSLRHLLIPLLAVSATCLAAPPRPLDRPYVPLFTIAHQNETRRLNNLPPGEREKALDDLSRWYVHFHCGASATFSFGDSTLGPSSPDRTLAQRLVERGALVSNYRNGSYVSQADRGTLLFGETSDLESTAPLAIATFWPGHKDHQHGSPDDPGARLIDPVDASAATVLLTSPAKHAPPRSGATWPYLSSRGQGAAPGRVISTSSRDFVSWLRLDDEILRITAATADSGKIRLTVDRGYFNTRPAPHAAGTRVLSPVYIGATTAATSDFSLAGSPRVDNPDKALRYGLKIWQKDATAWIARRIIVTFGNGKPAPYFQGYNAIWLDVSSSVVYNNADATGHPVVPWDDPANAIITPKRWAACQTLKVNGLKFHLANAGYPNLKYLGNNFIAGRRDDLLNDDLLSESGLDGGAFEYWLQNDRTWDAVMAQHFRAQANNWPAIYWIKAAPKNMSFRQYKRFTYGAYLLAYDPAATRPQFGGPFGLRKPDDFFFLNFGRPRITPKSLNDLKTPTGLYRRDFQNGLVLLNPTAQPLTHDLPRPFLNSLTNDRITSITISPRDVAFLVLP